MAESKILPIAVGGSMVLFFGLIGYAIYVGFSNASARQKSLRKKK